MSQPDAAVDSADTTEAARTPPRSAARFDGRIGTVNRQSISGWAHSPETPDVPVSLLVLANGELVQRVLADRERPDLAESV